MLKELFRIGDYPNLSDNYAFTQKLATLFKTYGLVFLSLFIVAPFAAIAEHLVTHVLHFKGILRQNDIPMQKIIRQFGYWEAMAFVCLIGPVLEETIFRLPLSFKRNHVALGLGFGMLEAGVILQRLFKVDWMITAAAFALPVLTYVAIRFLVPVNTGEKLQSWKKPLIITSICLFSLIHITNYIPVQWPIIWIYPVYVLPQLCMGWGMTYVRFKNGFAWGIALHCIINTVAMTLYAQHLK